MKDSKFVSQVDDIMAGGAIRRYHTAPVLRQQTVAEHSWRMASLVLRVCPTASAALLGACLWHDVSELVTGDVPGPVKWENELLRIELHNISSEFETQRKLRYELGPEEFKLLRWADLYEGLLFCLEEVESGNRRMRPVLDRYREAVKRQEPLKNELGARQYLLWLDVEKRFVEAL